MTCSIKPDNREPKAGDVLVAMVDDPCFRKGKEYRVYEDTPGDASVTCDICRGELRHYLSRGWRKQLAFAGGHDETPK